MIAEKMEQSQNIEAKPEEYQENQSNISILLSSIICFVFERRNE
jgi:hypothetical protein